MEQITVKPGHGVKVETQEEWAEVRGLLIKAGMPTHAYAGNWENKGELEYLMWSPSLNRASWGSARALCLNKITLDQLRQAANVVSTEQQALIDDGFTLWFGVGEMPVEKGTLVDVIYRDKSRYYGEPAGQTEGDAFYWGHNNDEDDIIAYRVHEQEETCAEDLLNSGLRVPESITAKTNIELGPALKHVSGGIKHDSQKPRPQLVMRDMAGALEQVIKLAEFGAKKYSDGNWLHVDDAHNRYTDAMLRHHLAEQQGELIDGETGIEHDVAVAWNALARLQIRINNQGESK